MEFSTPRELYEAYRDGYKGCIYEPEHMQAFMASLPMPHFGNTLHGSGKGKLSTPYKSVFNLSKVKPYLEAQTTGDCVSHGTRNAVDISRATQIEVGGLAEDFVTIGATEGIYGSRGHGGQGMSCSRAAEFVNNIGGVLLRQKYPSHDLSVYNANIGTSWGSRGGAPAELCRIGLKNRVQTVSLVKNIEQARDALANGYGIAVCSGYGFSATRDSKGFARRQGSWAHCMALIACDDTGNEPAFLVQNSWGRWNSGGHPEWGPIPDGSFLITADVADGMLSGGGSFAFSSVIGFPAQDLPDYGTTTFL